MFKLLEVDYLGHIISCEGVKPDPKKTRAIRDIPATTDRKRVERLLGTINYLSKFLPNISSITKPIRKLLKKDVEFMWMESQERAFSQIVDILSKEPVLTYDVKKPVTVSCDASKSGLGAVLLQDDKPIAFASRSMTDAEVRYAQIEKELLAVVFAMERCPQFTPGQSVTVESDHHPLEMIMKKNLSAAAPRLQRMLLKLQRYNFSLKYKPGKELVIAYTLSRACTSDSDSTMEEDVRQHVLTVVEW